MKQERIIQQRDRLLARLPAAGDILRGSLLHRTIRHRTGCPKCARGEGHPVAVLSVGYPGGVIRQTSLSPEQAADVRRSLDNFHKLKAALEKICELNHQLLRSEKDQDKGETGTGTKTKAKAKAKAKTKTKTVATVRGSK